MCRTLCYVHDPMCSWCWAFRPVWDDVRMRLAGLGIRGVLVLGGLAADTDEPMPVELRLKIQGIWRTIQRTVPGTPFNFEFWERCSPRRSTYPACRAVIAARHEDPAFEEPMMLAIQRAYYLEARNPSDTSTLIDLAVRLGLDRENFARRLNHPDTQAELLGEIRWARAHGVSGFPSLLLDRDGGYTEIPLDYRDPGAIISCLSR